jgi:hypothetical protein
VGGTYSRNSISGLRKEGKYKWKSPKAKTAMNAPEK